MNWQVPYTRSYRKKSRVNERLSTHDPLSKERVLCPFELLPVVAGTRTRVTPFCGESGLDPAGIANASPYESQVITAPKTQRSTIA
jgi:hypothetical protein